MADECIFCKIANGSISIDLLYDGEGVVAFRDINPAAPVHILIVPKSHIVDVLQLAETNAGLAGEIMTATAELARGEGVAEHGFRLVANTGPAAGQSVAHLHFHLLGGRELGWPPG